MKLARLVLRKGPVLLIVLFAWAQLAPAADTRPPNFVFLMADDLGCETLGCYGGTSYRTPNLDRLARTGVRFEHAYSMPVCHPTRVTLLTGRYPFRNPAGWGSFPKRETTLAQVLGSAGYATAVAGKWQLALLRKQPDHPQTLGFDESCLFGWHEGPRYHNPLIWQNGRRRRELEKPHVYGPDVYCDLLIDFMTRNKGRPFLAYYPMALCHEISDDFSPVPPPAPDGHYLSYQEMVEDMDRIAGRLIAALDRLGLREKTLILFTGDNGSPRRYLVGVQQRDGRVVRSHKPVVSKLGNVEIRGGKGSLTDAGTRVPLIANWKGTIPPEGVCDVPVDFSDFLPTLADLAGAQVPRKVPLDGKSFAPQLHGRKKPHRPWVYSERGSRCWVRTRRWKLYDNKRLFDVQSDPGEKNPVVPAKQSPEAAAARAELQVALDSLKGGGQ